MAKSDSYARWQGNLVSIFWCRRLWIYSKKISWITQIRRIGTDIDTINKVLKNGNQIEDSDKAEGYAYDGWKVFVSKITGLVITIEPSKRKKIKNESKVG
mgnify:CR=1 FL=1